MAETHKPQYEASSPDVEEKMSIGRYFATRIPTLIPPMNPAPNPFKSLTLLNRQQWLFFSVCFLKLVCLREILIQHRLLSLAGHGMLSTSSLSP